MRRVIKCVVDFADKLGNFAPKHPFPMKTTFRNCFLVNFSMEPHVLERALPSGLKPDLYNGKAFLSVVLADLEAMRPGFFPRILGSNFTQVVYRAIVRAPNNERGVYFVRSDADSVWMSLTGNVFSNFNFNLAEVRWKGREQLPWIGPGSLDSENAGISKPAHVKWLPSSSHSEGGTTRGEDTKVSFTIDPWICDKDPARIDATFDFSTASLLMPSSSHFAGLHVREAQKYFVELYAAFKSWPGARNPYWTAVHIDRTRWNITSVSHYLPKASLGGQSHTSSEVEQQGVYEFMQKSSLFGPGDCKLDSCFYVSDLDYHWHVREKHPLNLKP